MDAHVQNPGGQAGASRNQLDGWLHPSPTASGWQAQMLASRFFRSLPMARVQLCFGEGCKTDRPFPNHRQAALALLNGNCRLTRDAGRFLGQIAVDFLPHEPSAVRLAGAMPRPLPSVRYGGAFETSPFCGFGEVSNAPIQPKPPENPPNFRMARRLPINTLY